MIDFNYPLRRLYNTQGLIVDFTDSTTCIILESGNSSYKVGDTSSSFANHENKLWTPIKISKRILLHNKIKDFK